MPARAALPKPAAPRARPDLRDERMAALLDAAAAEFNLYGVAGASLSRITASVGVTRAALYYYVASREDLAFRCYQRACEVSAADLAAARASGKTGLARVLRYIALTLDPARPAAVVLSEIALLPEAKRAEIEEAHGANLRALQRFIEDGIRDRSIRDCDADIAAHALTGMLAWAPLAEEWSAGTGDEVHRHAAHAVADLVEHGVAADRGYDFHCPLDIASFAFQPGNAFDRDAVSAQKVELLTRTASRLFNQRGIDGTSLDQITQELGATKGAFYPHLPGKAALVVECHKRELDLSGRIAEAAEHAGANGLERTMIGMHLLVQAFASEDAPLSPLTGLYALPARALAQIRERGQALTKRYERMNQQGMKDGSLRKFDARVLSTLGAGVFSWIPKWRRADDPRPPRAVADETVALFLKGLARRK